MEFATRSDYRKYLEGHIEKLRSELSRGGLEPFDKGRITGQIDGFKTVLKMWNDGNLVERLDAAVASFVPGGDGYRRGTMTGRCEAYNEVLKQLSDGFGKTESMPESAITEIYIGRI